ncbi:MAG TPA: glycosyltransferase family 2 protein [Opitutaceae bacterium]
MTPLLSVIIVAYKSRDEILACVNSVPTTLPDRGVTRDVEIIVVDNNGNADGVIDLLAEHAPQVRCELPPSNLGFGRGNNLGYHHSRGECVLFLNPDTVCNATAIRHCIDRIRLERTIGLISPRLELPDGSMDLACRRSIPTLWDGFCRASGLARAFPNSRRFARYNLTFMPVGDTYAVGAINGAFMMTRRDCLGDVGLFDPAFFMYGDDLDLCIRFAQHGLRIVYDGRVAITHIKGVSVAREHASMSRAIFDANLAVYLKHFNPRGSRLVALKYRAAFGLWKWIALARGWLTGRRKVQPM